MTALSDAVTDTGFLCPAISLAALHDSVNATTYRYLYNGNFSNISPLPWQGAYHASELSLIFGTYGLPTESADGVTDFERQLSVRMQDLWLAFMRNPAGEALDALGWPKLHTNKSGNVLEFAPQATPTGPILMDVIGAESLSGVCGQ